MRALDLQIKITGLLNTPTAFCVLVCRGHHHDSGTWSSLHTCLHLGRGTSEAFVVCRTCLCAPFNGLVFDARLDHADKFPAFANNVSGWRSSNAQREFCAWHASSPPDKRVRTKQKNKRCDGRRFVRLSAGTRAAGAGTGTG